jgi:hypothetical protein
MASVVLIDAGADTVFTRRVRMRDRLRARFRAFALDEAIAAGAPPDSDAALTLRAGKLIGERTRSQLGSALREASTGVNRSPSVVRVAACPAAVEDASDLIGELVRRLLAPAPVEARGVAQARLLLSDGTSPLFWSRRSAESRERVRHVLAALEPEAMRESA